jgi:hypothetical protein
MRWKNEKDHDMSINDSILGEQLLSVDMHMGYVYITDIAQSEFDILLHTINAIEHVHQLCG